MLHAPKQSRSRRTLERILSAARTLIAQEGVDGVGVTQIVREAKSSVGSFYARFDGKDDLVRHLHERLWFEASQRWEQGVADWARGESMEDRVASAVKLVRQAIEPDFALRTSLTRDLEDDGSNLRGAFDERVSTDCVRLIDGRDGLRHPTPDRAVALGTRMTLSVLRDHLSTPEVWLQVEEDEELSGLDGLVRELETALRGYWGVGTVVHVEGTEPGTEIEYFDIWN